MNKGLNALLAFVIAIVILLASGVFYTVDETQQAVITQFGQLIGEPKTKPGLYFKVPFIQTVNYFDKRILQWDGDSNQIPTVEKRFIWVETTARWRIKDPLKYMQTVRNEASAQARLDDIIDAKTREVISSHNLVEAIRNSNRLVEAGIPSEMSDTESEFGKTVMQTIQSGREVLSRKIFTLSAPAVADYGIELVDVKIQRINYIQEVRAKVYERMISERKRAAEKFRSEGQGKRAEIEGQMAKELEQIKAEAYRQAQEIKGSADAAAINIYANAYNKDPEFYSFIKTLDTYRQTINKETTLILTTENEFYEYLNGIRSDNKPL